ncbi:HK97 gp10 family phage protein [Streptomyces sp. NPDC005506]|uniref:HK97 gp10 family phage protein n=1 Tax=Streptomyces sp. NPDC005506 TaxID=3364718 RepID=UPI0036B4AB5D
MDVQLDEAAIRALTQDLTVRKAVFDTAEQGRDFARSIAPVRTGRYRDSIEVVEDDDGADIVSDVDYAADLEYGNRHTEGQHIFGRTLDSMRSSGQP